ncbi:N-acetyltransferase [Euzebyella marina]|uniref:N-acetyltransferase n=1 Tax=Euzebyella marina TaxID=1761453 RepID=A0A3G2L283_9FLAO|nr:GNAT family N-acetyltransferase [Euzebyella marina]AYN66374.1 N-acetyltransferase [Euzebyella marina]
MKIEITDFSEEDREPLRHIYYEVRKTNFTWLPEEFLKLSSFDKDTEGESILVAKVNNEIVGFASIWSQDNFLHHLYVSNKFQGLGIGTRLLNHIIENSSADLTLKCLKNNHGALNFYLKNGWESISEGQSEEGDFILFKY